MKVLSAALILALTAAGAGLLGSLSSPARDVSMAQEPAPAPPQPSPTPGPGPTPSPPQPPIPVPTPTPTPTPAPGRPKPTPKPPTAAISSSGTASITQAFPLDYRSVAERLADDPDNPALLNELGNLLVQRGRPQAAIVQYERAVKLQPDLAILWNNLGVAYTASREFGQGERAYRRAIRISPAYALAYYNLGAHFDQRENYDQAIVYYQRAIELDPTLLDVRVNPQVASNRHLAAILVKSYLEKGGSVVPPVQSMYPSKPPKKIKP